MFLQWWIDVDPFFAWMIAVKFAEERAKRGRNRNIKKVGKESENMQLVSSVIESVAPSKKQNLKKK